MQYDNSRAEHVCTAHWTTPLSDRYDLRIVYVGKIPDSCKILVKPCLNFCIVHLSPDNLNVASYSPRG